MRRLEVIVDTLPWRIGERVFAEARDFRRRWRARKVAYVSSGVPKTLEARLDRALRRSRYSEAESLGAELEKQLDRLDLKSRASALPVLLELFCTMGDRDRAVAFARMNRALLESSPRGATMLDLLGIAREQSAWLPGGKPSYVALSRGVADGTLDGDGLLALFARRPFATMRYPQLYLVASSAFRRCDPMRSVAYLNRFLRTHKLGPCSLSGQSGHFLADLSFAEHPPVDEGPLVSVIMSVFNAEATVGYALESILSQSYRTIEVLACDDASRDGTRDVLRRYAADPRVRLFASESNQGTYNVRNALLERARGSLLTFQDADDVALPQRLSRQVAAIGNAEACVTSWLRVTEDGQFVFFRDQNAVRLSVVSLMMTRATYKAVGPYRSTRFGADLEILERIRSRRRLRRLHEPLLLGLWSSRSLTRTADAEALEDGYRSPARRVYSELVQLRRTPGADPRYIQRLEEELARRGNFAVPQPIVDLK